MDMPSLFFKYLFHKHPKKRKEKGDGVRVMMFNATDGIGESLKRCLCIGYSTIETQEVDRIGYNGFLFPHEYSGEGRGATTVT
jgi:hypothetical protein